MKDKYIGKHYKSDHNSVTEYWKYWPIEVAAGVVNTYNERRYDHNHDALMKSPEPRVVVKYACEENDPRVPPSAYDDVIPGVLEELQNVIDFLQAVIKENSNEQAANN